MSPSDTPTDLITIEALRKTWLRALNSIARFPYQAEAEWELASEACFGITREAYYQNPNQHISPQAAQRLNILLEKRCTTLEPIQYLLGEGYFLGRSFQVTPDVLIPRPESEVLIQVVLAHGQSTLAYQQPSRPYRVLDLATGSGCLAITLQLEAARAGLPIDITASDISPAALIIAKHNAKRHGMEQPITWIQSDWFKQIPRQAFDYIISNPPYVDPKEMESLAPDVKNYEPHLALMAPHGTARVYKTLAQQALPYLSKHGRLAVEFGDNQGPCIHKSIIEQGYLWHATHQDGLGLDRVMEFAKSRI